MAKCLYSGDKPLGIVQSNAEDVEYSSGVSVKDKIDGLTATISDTLVAGDKILDYPTDFDITNCIVVGFMYQAGTARWDTLPNHNYATVNVSLRSDKIYVYNSSTDLAGKTFKATLLKIS